jgi:phosphate:Na+ symporter
LLALDHASRLAEIAGEKVGSGVANGGPDDRRAAELCAEAMRNAASVAAETAAPHADAHSIPDKSRPAAPDSPAFDAQATPCEDALVRLGERAKALGELQLAHRSATLGAVAAGELTADEAMARVDAVRRLEVLARHAWLAAGRLAGRDS